MEIFADENKELSGLLFQDSLMKATYAAFPEVLCVDTTYKLNNLRMPLYVFLAIDGNGQSEIVGIFITSLETEEAILNMVKKFKNSNSSWVGTRVEMTDKDFVKRTVFSKEFPDAALTICLFHTLRSFKREITCEKMQIRSGERDHALELIVKLAYSKSEAVYNDNYEMLLQSGPSSVISYFNTNWHPIRAQWVECYKGVNFTLGESTNNRLESINSKIKSVCSKHVNLTTFFDQFFAVLSCLRNERDHATLMAVVKKRVVKSVPNSPEWEYASIATPYAFYFLQQQLDLVNKVKINGKCDSLYLVLSSEGNLTVTDIKCSCKFWKTMHLPC